MATADDAWKNEVARALPEAAERVDAALDEETKETLSELAACSIHLPGHLTRFCAIDDGARIDLAALGGSKSQESHDLYGILDSHHPEDGQFGALVADGVFPKGAVMIRCGMTQLLYDAVGALGPNGAFWSTQDLGSTRTRSRSRE